MIDMEELNGCIDDKIIQAIEQDWGFGLPKSYKKFLINTNGGRSRKKYFFFKEQENGSVLTDFFGILKDYNTNILLKYKYVGIRVPFNTLPIASDCFGNLILIAVKGAEYGKVYFWDHDWEAEDGVIPDYSNLTLIADNFDEFINNLKSQEEIDALL